MSKVREKFNQGIWMGFRHYAHKLAEDLQADPQAVTDDLLANLGGNLPQGVEVEQDEDGIDIENLTPEQAQQLLAMLESEGAEGTEGAGAFAQPQASSSSAYGGEEREEGEDMGDQEPPARAF